MKRRYLRLFILILIVLPGIPFLLFNLAYLSYLFWPHDFSDVTEFPLLKSAQHLTISVHGLKDRPESWSHQLQSLIAEYSTIKEQQNISLNWRSYSNHALTCATFGQAIGQQIGQRIVRETQVNSIHAVAHSCGSFVVYGLCQQVKKSRSDISVQVTYLAPASVYAGFWWNYGIEQFGSCADFSDVYIDTDDTVPGSNQALPNGHTFDITAQRIRIDSPITPHLWPTQYYLQQYQSQKVPLLKSNPNVVRLYKRGGISVAQLSSS